MKTRATKKVAPAKPREAEETSDNSKSLAPNCSNPPLLFILPDNPSPDARIVTLPSPATSSPARYYFCPEQGIYEFTKIAAPKKSPRSWLLAPPRTEKDVNRTEENPEHGEKDDKDSAVKPASDVTDVSTGYVIQDADLFLATSLDPLFVLLPALIPNPDETKQLYLTIEDHLDTLAENSKHLKHLIRSDKLRRTFNQRANVVCDNVDMGDENMYRLSIDKLLAELLKKAEKMSASGLPASMEEHFVQDALKVPVMIVQREESFSESQPDAEESSESQASATTITPSLHTQDSSVSVLTEATSIFVTAESPAPSVPTEIVTLLRLRTALQFIMSSYIPPALRSTLLTALSSSTSPINFKPLDAHLDKIASLKKEQHALRSLSDNISRKRSGANDEEVDFAREEKKRKKDEEDAKKKNTSRGVKQLAKVDTSGMKKLSSFFTKAPAKKKA
ncbi:ribonuclease H2, subunit B [Delphinella strobiligena]|nr:ribonuclease H2, subunit B [Delphinella strobiligena]